MGRLSGVFLSGLLALLPLAVTLAVLGWAISFLNAYVGPGSFFGQLLVSLGMSVGVSSAAPYVIGLIAFLVAIYVLGLLVESRLGAWLVRLLESLIGRIPLVSHVYDLSKRFTAIVDTKEGNNLKSMSPVWCFFGGEPGAAVLALLPSRKPVMIGGKAYLGVLVPSAPVPIGGALVYVPEVWVRPAEGGVDELMSVYVSMGVTPPRTLPKI
jgi:uncharacterized membrane protein